MEGKKYTVLIIEDELVLLDVLADKLTREGFKALKAKNGEEGVKMALGKRPDLVLLDIVMPVMDGLTALGKIRADKRGKNIPVIMLTNLSDSEKLETAQKYNAKDYLIKTDWTLNDVIKKIKKRLK